MLGVIEKISPILQEEFSSTVNALLYFQLVNLEMANKN